MFQGKNAKWAIAIVPWIIFMFFFHPSFGQGVPIAFKEVPSTNGIAIPSEIINPVIPAIPIVPTTPSFYAEAIINPVALLVIFFGISYLALLILCAIAFHTRENRNKIKIETKVILGMMVTLLILLACFTFSGATAFSSRMGINLCLVLGLLLCLFISITLQHNQSKLVKIMIISLAAVGILPNLINWISLYDYKELANVLSS